MISTLNNSILAFFFHQLCVLGKSGIPLVKSWELILTQVSGQKNREALQQVVQDIKNGRRLSEAMIDSRKFPMIACNIVKAGENSGSLDIMFGLLGDYYAAANKEKQNMISALLYPTILLIATAVMMMGAIIFILPVFAEMFDSMAVPLPAPTRVLIDFQQSMHTKIIYYLPVLGLTVLTMIIIAKDKVVQYKIECKLLKVENFRKIFIAWCWQHFGCILSIQLAAGIPLLQAIDDSISIVPMQWFKVNMAVVKEDIAEGVSFSVAIKNSGCGTSYIATMLSVAESTGNYEDAVKNITEYYKWMISIFVNRFSKLLEPSILLVVGSAIGVIVLCLLLPLFDVATSMNVDL